MAYAYDKLYNAMGRQPQPEPQQTNIFAGEQVGAPAGGAQQQMPGSSAARVRTASTEGQLGPETRAAKPQGTESGAAPGPTSSSAAVRANVGKTQAPVDLGKISSSIGDAKAKVQGEADTFLQGESIQPFTGSPGSKAVTPEHAVDPATFAKVDEWALGIPTGAEPSPYPEADGPDWMTTYQQGPGGARAFEAKTNTDFRDVQDLATDAGVQNLLRRRGDAEYTAGEAAFDAGLLRQDPRFQEQRRQVLDANKDLVDTKAKLEAESQGKAQNARNANFNTWKDAITRHLDEIAKGYRTDALRREAAFDADLDTPANYANTQADEVLRDLKADPQFASLANQLSLEGIDVGGFVQAGMNPDQTSAEQFYTPEEAARFSKILDLLGRGGERPLGDNIGNLTRVTATDRRATYDKEGLRQAILGAAQQRAQEQANVAPFVPGTANPPPILPEGVVPTQPGPGDFTPPIVIPGETGEPIYTVPGPGTNGMPTPTEPNVPSQQGQANVPGAESGEREPRGGTLAGQKAKDLADVVAGTLGAPVEGGAKVGDKIKQTIKDTGADTGVNKAGGAAAKGAQTLTKAATPAATSTPKISAAIAAGIKAAEEKRKKGQAEWDATQKAAAAKKAAAKAAAARPPTPILPAPVADLSDLQGYGGMGAGGSGWGLATSPSFPAIQAAIAKAGGDVAKAGKEKAGSAVKTVKKVLGRK